MNIFEIHLEKYTLRKCSENDGLSFPYVKVNDILMVLMWYCILSIHFSSVTLIRMWQDEGHLIADKELQNSET